MHYKLSVITPSFNSSKHIRGLIESIEKFKRKYDFFEYIVVDGQSTDDTLSILSSYKDIIDKIIIKKDKNMYQAINTGINESRAPLLSYINCDDRLNDNFFNSLSIFEDNSISVVYGKCKFIFEKKTKVYSYPKFNLHRFAHTKFSLVSQPGTIFRRDAFKKLNGFDDDLDYASDYDFFLRLGLNNFKYFYNPKVLADFLVHADSLSSLNKQKIKIELDKIYKKNGFKKNYIYKFLYNKFSSLKFKIDNYL